MIIANQHTFKYLHRYYFNKSVGYAYYSLNIPATKWVRPAFLPSVVPSATRAELGSREATPAIHNGRGNGVNATGEVLHNRETAMCGRCSQPFAAHGDNCDRDNDQFGSGYEQSHDYYQYGPVNYNGRPTAHIVPYIDTEGYPEDEVTEEFYRDNEWQSIHDLGDYGTEDLHWKDKEPRECTSIAGSASAPEVTMRDGSVQQMYIDTSAIEAQSRTVYVEGIAGYHSIKVLDLLITAKSHAKMLNVYKQNGQLRIGGLTLVPNIEVEDAEFTHQGTGEPLVWKQVTATCNHFACRYQDKRRNWRNAQFSIAGYDLTWEQKEDFVYSLIRHGNNHAAPWFRDRVIARASHRIMEAYDFHTKQATSYTQSPWVVSIPKDTKTFYKVHERTCSLDCNPTAVNCVPVVTA